MTQKNLKTLEFKISINSTSEKLWKSLWESENYTKWTSKFCEGSYYKTNSFTEGNKIHLLTPEGHGMYSILDKIEINKFLALRHLGNIKDFEEQPLDEATKSWTNAIESYKISPKEKNVELLVKVDTIDEYIDFMNKTFPIALQELKVIAENQ